MASVSDWKGVEGILSFTEKHIKTESEFLEKSNYGLQAPITLEVPEWNREISYGGDSKGIQSRLLLTSLGWLSNHYDSKNRSNIHILEHSSSLLETLTLLDKTPECVLFAFSAFSAFLGSLRLIVLFRRLSIRSSVVFAAHNQKTEEEIVGNTTASKEFFEFVTGLGKLVDVKSFPGYLGNLQVGDVTPYYANQHAEMAFHVGPLLPTTESDTSQKR
jgi:hypothetical protein